MIVNLKNFEQKDCIDVATFSPEFVPQKVDRVLKVITNNINGQLPENEDFPDLEENQLLRTGQFCTQQGFEYVQNLMKKWSDLPALHEWTHNVKFITYEADEQSRLYVYEVKWSKPIDGFLIPLVTASVFFCFEVLICAPYIIDVTHIFEGQQFVHRSKIKFQPMWLYDIFNMKTMMFKTFTF